MSTATTSTSPTDVGQALINALNNPTGNLTRSLLLADQDGNITGKRGSRFILQSNGYLDLRASLVASQNFPLDAASFETLYPNASLQSLHNFDPLLYKQTETAILDFWNAWTIFIETQMICQALIDQLTGEGGSSLQGVINTLTSQTYSQPGSGSDPEFKSLAQSASEMFLNLSQAVNQRTSSIQALAGTISAQGSKIQATKTEIDAVVQKFGVEAGDGYISTLDEKTPMNLIFLSNIFEAVQAVKADWDREMMEAGTTVSYIYIPVAGWISGSNAILTKQKDVRLAWDKYQAQIAKKSNDTNKTAYALVGAVNLLSFQNGALCDKIQSVERALGEIQSTFAAIGSNLGQVATMMAAADGTVRTSLIANQQAIQAGIANAVKEFQDTLSAVNALVTIDSNFQTTGITADINAPSVFPENS
ncbi:uncharacterized protein FMAN_13167 [Fusarium mangiferae]|uniref:Uncharacterized protein n=1 Tax=Fusarium mangiferae TaxID=192010 RepID=A0A1L7TA95_FUSMA|nr:uncharacterized protein FMAN_13167 [Fusarium mangiferae]CVK94859.1 uncharacterized protein FMAN_13167 [Fusarium mangiferae]